MQLDIGRERRILKPDARDVAEAFAKLEYDEVALVSLTKIKGVDYIEAFKPSAEDALLVVFRDGIPDSKVCEMRDMLSVSDIEPLFQAFLKEDRAWVSNYFWKEWNDDNLEDEPAGRVILKLFVAAVIVGVLLSVISGPNGYYIADLVVENPTYAQRLFFGFLLGLICSLGLMITLAVREHWIKSEV